MKGLCRIALAVLFVGACGGDSGVTGLDESVTPNAPLSGGGILAIGVDSTTGASIETNQDDYIPGEVVHLVGRGWTSGETVNLRMTESPNTHADVDTNVVADANGGFSLHFYDVQVHDLGVTFTLTATGTVSHSQAVAVFTDGNFALRAASVPAGVPSFTGTLLKFAQSESCEPASPGQTSITTPAVTTSAGPSAGVNEDNSALFTVPSTVGAYTFSHWTITGGSATLVTGTVNTPSICVLGTASGSTGARTFTANYIVSNVEPTVDAGVPYSVAEGTELTLSPTVTDADAGDVLTYKWTVNTSGIDAGGACTFVDNTVKNAKLTCTDDSQGAPGGKFTLTLEVKDGVGGHTVTDNAELTVTNVAPQATFTTPGSVSLSSTFSISLGSAVEPGANDVSALQYSFDCGGGYDAFNSTPNRTCTATTLPSQSVRGKIRDQDGGESEYTASVAVNNQAPLADAGGDYSTNEGGSGVGVSGSGSDPDGGTVTYLWTVAPAGICSFGNANAAATTVTCTDNGSFTLTLKVTDDENAFTTDDAALNVTNVKPTATFNAPASVNEGSPINLSLSDLVEPSSVDAASIEYAFDCGSGYGSFGSASSTSCPTTDEGIVTVKGTVRDKDGGSNEYTKSVTILNVPPVITLNTTAATLSEGSTFSRNGSFTDPGTDSWTATVNYGDGGGAQALVLSLPAKTFNLTHVYTQDGAYTVTVTVNDGDGGTDTETISITVNNVAPELNLGAATASLNEGSTFTRSGSFTDPGADTWTATVNYGDASGVQALTLNPDKTFNLSHTYPQDGPFTVTVSIDDGDEGTDTETISLTVNNVLPNVAAFSGAEFNEGGSYSTSGSFTDPGADTWTATVDYGDGSGTQALALSGKNFTLNHTYTDDDGSPFTVTVTVYDDDGSGSKQATVIVHNVGPQIVTPLSLPASPVAMGSAFSMTWTFTDPGSDQWTCKISWDQPVAYGTPFASSGKSCSISGAGLAAGVYTVTVYVEDDDEDSDAETATTYIVVYDPNGGFVTGGGWINSVAGNYRLNLSAEGKANFGFVSKYQPGKNVPTGNTEFQFHAGDLNFKSTVYEWLVVAGTKAMYKGEGTIAGRTGVYGFLLSAIDGSPDKFRIKIWEKSTGNLVYDTLPTGADDDADPTTALGGGSIVVHTKK